MAGDFVERNALSEKWSYILAAFPYGIGIIEAKGRSFCFVVKKAGDGGYVLETK